MALGERMLFGVGVVGNILKSAVSLHLLFLIGTLSLPHGVRECNFSLTPGCFIRLDPWQSFFYKWSILGFSSKLISFSDTHCSPWSDSCLLLWLCFPPISCHSKFQSSYAEGFVISQPLLPIQASCPMLSTLPYMWNSLPNLVSCFSALKTWVNYYFLWEAIFCDSHPNLLLFPTYFPILCCAFPYWCIDFFIAYLLMSSS